LGLRSEAFRSILGEGGPRTRPGLVPKWQAHQHQQHRLKRQDRQHQQNLLQRQDRRNQRNHLQRQGRRHQQNHLEWTLEGEMAAVRGATDKPDKAASPQGKAATQDRILQAAMNLFMRRGYARTSVTQIANKAGVSRAAVFWHFSDKDTLFRAAAKQFVEPFREGLARHLRHLEPRKRIIELISFYEKFVEQNRPNIVAFVNWVLESPEQSGPIRDELLGLHEAFRAEVEAALTEVLGDANSASEYANGLISLMDGNLMLGIFGAGASARARQRSGLRAVAELILNRGDPDEPN
jgi:AcrR family transcriptional regulator